MDKNEKTVRLRISMAYTFVGDTGIDVPAELLEGKSEDEKLKIAYEYATEHIDEIPVAGDMGYISNSDSFDLEDCIFEDINEDYDASEIITKEMIKSGIKAGLITFVTNTNHVCDTVYCKIGDNQFYFDVTNEERDFRKKYKKNVPEDVIIDEIFKALESFRQDGKYNPAFWNEYDYYWHILMYRNDM